VGRIEEHTPIPNDSSDEPGLDSSALSIDFFLPHGHNSLVQSFFFSFLTSSQERHSIDHNLIPSVLALDSRLF